MKTKLKSIAIYLPQYHPISENDEWWGRGFTEWTNVTKSRPQFQGHQQPHLPADLGFYDLRLSEAREAQAALAREYGVYGFCYYHYWFNGRRLLERPFNEVLASGKPEFPFCLCWANENWTRGWDGFDQSILVRHIYSAEDDIAHLRSLVPAFTDERYIRVEGKPLFLVYRSSILPDAAGTTDRWRQEALRLGVGELFLCKVVRTKNELGDPREEGYDASVDFHPFWEYLGWPLPNGFFGRLARRVGLMSKAYGGNLVYDYADYVENVINRLPSPYPNIPCVMPSWDNSARRERALIFANNTPELYTRWLTESARQAIAHPVGNGNAIVFINAWNEWAEGNHLEPCQRWGRAYLEATRDALQTANVLAGLL